jgi:hypothetical protein
MHHETRYRRNVILTNVVEFTGRFTPSLLNVLASSKPRIFNRGGRRDLVAIDPNPAGHQ